MHCNDQNCYSENNFSICGFGIPKSQICDPISTKSRVFKDGKLVPRDEFNQLDNGFNKNMKLSVKKDDSANKMSNPVQTLPIPKLPPPMLAVQIPNAVKTLPIPMLPPPNQIITSYPTVNNSNKAKLVVNNGNQIKSEVVQISVEPNVVNNPKCSPMSEIRINTQDEIKECVLVNAITMTDFQQKYYNKVVEIANKHGWTIISTNYVDQHELMIFKCPQNHIVEISADIFKRKHICNICDPNNRRAGIKYTYDVAMERCKEVHGDKFSYHKVNPFTIDGVKSIITIVCNNCYIEETLSLQSHLKNKGCKKCKHIVRTEKDNVIDEKKTLPKIVLDDAQINWDLLINGTELYNEYQENIIYVESIINEAKQFLELTPLTIQQRLPLINYDKTPRWCFDRFVNESRHLYGEVFDYSLTPPENINSRKSKIIVRCLFCTYKQSISICSHLVGHGCQKCNNCCMWYYEIFIYAAYLIHGNKYIYPIIKLDERIGTNKHLMLKCKKCLTEWSVTITNHLKTGCPECSIASRRWNFEKFLIAANNIHKNKYDYSATNPLDINSNMSRANARCTFCNYRWYPVVNDHIGSRAGCPNCSGHRPWTYSIFLETAFLTHGHKYYYGLINPEDINGKDSKIPICCLECGYFWYPTIHNHINGSYNCPGCSLKAPWTYELFIERAELTHKGKYNYDLIIPSSITCKDSVITLECPCSYIWQLSVYAHIYGSSNCPRCAQQTRYTLEILIERIIKIHDKKINYSLIKDEHVQNNASHVPLICNKCQKCWSPSIRNLIHRASGCPRCKASKGEKACAKYLSESNISFEEQFQMPELERKRYDFFIVYDNMKWVIEFDGVIHFKFVEFFHKSPEKFINRQKIDVLKTITAINNNYNIIRIDHKQINNVGFHIEKALKLGNKTYFSNPEMYTYITRQL